MIINSTTMKYEILMRAIRSGKYDNLEVVIVHQWCKVREVLSGKLITVYVR